MPGNRLQIGAEQLNGLTEEHIYSYEKMGNHPAITGPAYRLHRLTIHGLPFRDHIYYVARTEHGLECTCGDYQWRREGMPLTLACKHIRGVVFSGLIPATAAELKAEQEARTETHQGTE